jgi:carboxyvinyl-carboxyphosphonate phosphorylmutase
VEELEHAGAAATTIEDTDLPQPFGKTKHALISIQEAEAKIRTAVQAVRENDFVVIGRTAAASIADLDEALARGKAMEAAGADALFFSGISSAEQLEALAHNLRGPFVLGGVGKAICDQQYLASQRVRLALRGHHAYTATIHAAYATLLRLRNGTRPEDLSDQPSDQFLCHIRREITSET